MIHGLSEDDTLLGRGANPRTGCITPTSGGSIDGDTNQGKDIHTFNSAAPTTWLQRGDQWVSVRPDLSAPIKSTTTDSVLLDSQPRRAWTPSRFSEKNSSLLAKASALRQRSYSHTRGVPLMGTERIPTITRPESPTSSFGRGQAQFSQLDQPIKRKPVGESPSKAGPSFVGPAIVSQRGQHMPLTPPPSRDGNRSISTPVYSSQHSVTNRAIDESSQRGGGQNEHGAKQDVLREQTFPLFRSQTVGDLNQLYGDTHCSNEVNVEKALPCLPMSGGPYRQIRFECQPTTTAKRIKKKSILSLQNHQQAVPTTHAKTLHRRSHIVEMMNPSYPIRHNRTPDWVMRHGISEIPNYDNPPPNSLPRTKSTPVRGPREMPRISQMRDNKRSLERVHTDPYSTISTTTNTSTPTIGSRTVLHRVGAPFPPQTQPPPMIPLPPTPRPMLEPIMTDVSHVQKSAMTCREPPSIPPRSSKRAQIPMQTESAEPIIQSNPSLGGHRETHMGPYSRSNMTGMLMKDLQAPNALATTRGQSYLKMQRQVNLEPNNATTNVGEMPQILDPRQSRRCSRCQDGFVMEQPHNIDGSTGNVRLRRPSRNSANAPEAINELSVPTPITERTELQSSFEESTVSSAHFQATSATIVNVENDLCDHSMCCPDCCKLDCHEGCLGHSSLCSTPTKKSSFDIGGGHPDHPVVSPALQSPSAITPTTTGDEGRKSRLGLIKSIIRSAVGQRHGIGSPVRSACDVVNKNGQYVNSPSDLAAKYSLTQKLQEHAGHDSVTSTIMRDKQSGFEEKAAENGLNQLMLIIPKTRSNKKKAITPTECRSVISSRPCSGNQAISSLHLPQNRTVSGRSAETRIPSLDTISPASLFKVLFLDYGHFALNQWWSMSCVAAATGKLLLYVIYVYSKTGMFKVKKQDGQILEPWELIFDSVRSGVYVWILLSIAVIAMRIAAMFGPMAGILLLFIMAAYIHRMALARGSSPA